MLAKYITEHNQYVERMVWRHWAHAGDKIYDANNLSKKDKEQLAKIIASDLSANSEDRQDRNSAVQRDALLSAQKELLEQT